MNNNAWRERFLKRSFLILLMLSLLFLGGRQEDVAFCDTTLTKEQIEYELSRKKSPINFEHEKIHVLSIRAHIVRNNKGEGGISEEKVLESIETLNRHFKHTKIGFEICSFNYIDKTHLFNFNKIYEKELVENDADSTINIYFVDKIASTGDGTVCGYTYYPTKNQNHIILSNGCVANNTSLTHEMGHFFGLYHTHEEKFGVELVNGANCLMAGDLICDTPADPGLTGRMISPTCEYLGFLMDPVKSIYDPPVDNYMSYTRKECRTLFTVEQSKKMRENYQIFKSYIKKINIGLSLSDTLIFRGENVTLEATGGTHYKWNTGDSSSIIQVTPDSTIIYSVNIFTPDGCNVFKRKKIEIFPEPIIETPSFRCASGIDTLKIISSSKNLKYQLFNQDEVVSDTILGNDSTLVFVLPDIQKNESYKLWIYREKVLDTFKIEKSFSIPLIPLSDTLQEVISQNQQICEGEIGAIIIPRSNPQFDYQLVNKGHPYGPSYKGNGDSLRIFTDPIYDLTTFDLRISNICGESLIKNAAVFDPFKLPSSMLVLGNLKKEIVKGESANFTIPNSEPKIYYQLYVNNTKKGMLIKGSGGVITFNTGPLFENSDICILIKYSECERFLDNQFHLEVSDPPQVKLSQEDHNILEVAFTLRENSQVKIQVYDLLGKLLINNSVFYTEGDHILDFSNIKKGRYYIKIFIDNKLLYDKITSVE